MKKLIIVFVGVLSLISFIGIPSKTLAATSITSIVIDTYDDCDYFVAGNTNGFVVLEWYGGIMPEEMDKLVGQINSYGFKNIYNTTKRRNLRVWVEDYLLTAREAVEIINEKCNL